MEISCPQCSQKYQLPPEKVDDKRVYFYCENCGHRIVIDRTREGWFSFLPLKNRPLTATDLFDGVFLSFSRKNILFTYMVLLFFSLCGGIFALILRGNFDFFGRHLFLTGFLAWILMLVAIWLFDMHLYFISKNITHRIETGEETFYREFTGDFKTDFSFLFTVSAGILIIFTILLFPVYLMKSHFSFVYTGFFSGLLLILGALFFFTAFFRDQLIAFIAMKPRTFREATKSLGRFIAVEAVNIPLYSFLNAVISCFLILVVFAIMGSAAAVIIWSATVFISPELAGQLHNFSGTFSSLSGEVETMGSGIILGIFFSTLVFLFITAWIVNLVQALAVTALRIMSSNPGRSIHRGVTFTVMAVTALVIILAAAGLVF